jgi:hypothetical protein
MKRFADRAVAAVFKAYPAGLGRKFMELRALVFDVAVGVGRLTETLKWGQPSYLTEEAKSGTTVRIDRLKKGDGYAPHVHCHCQRDLVSTFRELYPDTFRYEGRRALLFDTGVRLPLAELRDCIGLALTRHLRTE